MTDTEPSQQRPGRRRRRPRRRQATQAAGASAPASQPTTDPVPEVAAPIATPAPTTPATEPVPAPRKRRPSRDAGTERGLRDLVGAGSSQLGVSGALRGRDVNRPTDEDIAEAERTVTVVRRNWRPPSSS